ncbi:hypothetical protein BV22DRAFT_1047295 [Leucogyrophana mollusca]|uniref:Uncharacterized protein n=1 Tax=Leucogyrophana mollusca TaxID=85980 RepID=A0ACB8BFS8_9AGAM|nr:hypothetical protein BV22DRAFT_1047295 [Leucogyrophana mollusca]
MTHRVHSEGIPTANTRHSASPIKIHISVPVEVFQCLENGDEVSVSLRKDRRFSAAHFSSDTPKSPSQTCPPSVIPASPQTIHSPQLLSLSSTRPISRRSSLLELNATFNDISLERHEPATSRAISAGSVASSCPPPAESPLIVPNDMESPLTPPYNPADHDTLLHVMPVHPCLVWPLSAGREAPPHPPSASKGANKRFYVITKGYAVGVFYGSWPVIGKLCCGVPGAIYQKVTSLVDAKAQFNLKYPNEVEILPTSRH